MFNNFRNFPHPAFEHIVLSINILKLIERNEKYNKEVFRYDRRYRIYAMFDERQKNNKMYSFTKLLTLSQRLRAF